MNQEIDEFHIPLSSTGHASEFVKVNVEIDPKSLDIAQSKIWFVLEDRSGIKGEPENDPNNTIGWFHNNVLNTNQTLYSGTAPAQTNPQNLVFSTTNMGPLYTLRVFSNIRRLFSRTNKAAADRIRLREQFVSTDFLTDPQDVIKFLSLNLASPVKVDVQ